MPLGKVLSDEDKTNIERHLKQKCEEFWITNGYKKTSIKDLCSNASISVGTFYTLYSTKEDLFFETLMSIQNRLKDSFFLIIKQNPSIDGFCMAMKDLCREYDSKPFLYNANTADFQSFMTKLPIYSQQALKLDSAVFFRHAINTANLKNKVEEEQAFSVLSTLLSTISSKESLSLHYDYFATFDFMVDTLIPEILE